MVLAPPSVEAERDLQDRDLTVDLKLLERVVAERD
jgi:hypothetical protein